MSLLPFILGEYNDPWEYQPRRVRNNWDHFDLGITPLELQLLKSIGGLQLPRQRSNEPVTSIGKDGFQISVDVQQFKPNEITVKTVDNAVVIEGEHQERNDEHGSISRHFVRKYTLPKNYDPKDVVSTLSSDGVLTVKAPPPQKSLEGENERIVQIQQTGPAHLNVKENSEEDSPKINKK